MNLKVRDLQPLVQMDILECPWFHMNNRVKLCTKSRDRKKFIGTNGTRNQLFLVEFDRVSEEIRQQRITSQYVSPESVIETMKIMDEIRKSNRCSFSRRTKGEIVMDRNEILDLISQMTLEEKASLTSGKNTFNLKGIERLNIPEATTGDGPHGLRKPIGDGIGMRGSQTATCFPTACALASSWDESLLRKTGGEALANQAKAQGVHILLGPGTNIKRSPLCGRNFEYFSEDPLLSATLSYSLY